MIARSSLHVQYKARLNPVPVNAICSESTLARALVFEDPFVDESDSEDESEDETATGNVNAVAGIETDNNQLPVSDSDQAQIVAEETALAMEHTPTPLHIPPSRKARSASWSVNESSSLSTTPTSSQNRAPSKRRTQSFAGLSCMRLCPSVNPRTPIQVLAPPGEVVSVPPAQDLSCPVEGCGYWVPHQNRKSDLRRHINRHFTRALGPEAICCGVPLKEAEKYGITNFSDCRRCPRTGQMMVGGCWTTFIRKDGYKRHLNANKEREGGCRGDTRGYWIL